MPSAPADGAPKIPHRRKKKPAKAAPKHATLLANTEPGSATGKSATNDEITIAYEPAPPPPIDGNSAFAELSGVFSRFEELAVAKTAKQEEATNTNDGGDESSAFKASSQTVGDEEDDAEAEAKAIASKKKKKLEQRLSIAQLKQIVPKPEVVEWVDITAANPTLLVHLKSCRNSVPIPIHWQQKRKYLQGKRGIEKSAFELPDFIKQTGIMDLRQAVKDKEDSAKLKSKQRERVQPKMGKLDIDYQKLHDAFFRWQTKPPLSLHGEMYYEGKEYETKMKFKKPGVLSQELRTALGMGDDPTIAPPWLINMQRYGPPPSYPGLKIPGLNCPIPPGAVWGYQPGGWGKPPVDEYGRPLYGDVFGTMGSETTLGGMNFVSQEHVAPIERTLWGELEPEEEPEEIEEEQNEPEEEEEEERVAAQEEPPASGLVTPSGLASVPSGLETPEFIELRKESRRDDGPKELYKIIPQKENAIRGFMGSQHTYDLSAAGASATFAPPPPSSGTTSSAGSAKRKMIPGLITDKPVAMSLNPEDLEDGLSGDAVKRAYEDKMRATRKEAAGEDFSDLVAEHAGKMANKKRRKEDEKGKKSSGREEKFKF
ncbi:Splicing factor 3B subunit 2 [Entophlyctis sp. JEL0112]|nr:Splicing factor 3B subunit 2 [Entophlyctis sp. JEL0112]